MEKTPPPPPITPEMQDMAQAVLSLYYHCVLSSGQVKPPLLEHEDGRQVPFTDIPAEYKILPLDAALEKLTNGNPPPQMVSFGIMVLARSARAS